MALSGRQKYAKYINLEKLLSIKWPMVEKERQALNFLKPKRKIVLLYPCIPMECTNWIPVRRKTDETINTLGCVGYGRLDFYKPRMKIKIWKQQLPRFFAPFRKMRSSSRNQYYFNVDGKFFRFVDITSDGDWFIVVFWKKTTTSQVGFTM